MYKKTRHWLSFLLDISIFKSDFFYKYFVHHGLYRWYPMMQITKDICIIHIANQVWFIRTPVMHSSCVNFIYQLEDELHIENNQIYLHPFQPHSPANNFFQAQQIFNGQSTHSEKNGSSGGRVIISEGCFTFLK